METITISESTEALVERPKPKPEISRCKCFTFFILPFFIPFLTLPYSYSENIIFDQSEPCNETGVVPLEYLKHLYYTFDGLEGVCLDWKTFHLSTVEVFSP